jgi:hypothetical protein
VLEFGAAHCDSTESGANLKWLGPGLCIGAERPAGGSMERMLLQARASRKLPAAIHSVAVGVSVLCCATGSALGPSPRPPAPLLKLRRPQPRQARGRALREDRCPCRRCSCHTVLTCHLPFEIHHHSSITLWLVAHLGTFVLFALERFFSLGPHGPGLRPSNKPDLT